MPLPPSLASRLALLLVLVAVPRAAAGPADCTIRVQADTELGVVSPQLFGMNAIYCNEPDAAWAPGPNGIPARLKQIGTGIVRYPAGTVTTYYHWTNPTGQGWADSWDPKFNPTKNKPATDFMSLDEYLDFARASGITPLVGVNMGSGARFNRVAEGIEEAKALVRHCLSRGANVRYYYLDNEPYARDANRPMSAEEYAAQVNLYAPALKAIDPNIKIIANLVSGPTRIDEVRKAVRIAGQNIDFVDLHFYWRHGTATFAAWTSEPHMLHQRGRPYSEQRAIYRKIFAEEGHPAIDLVSFEWNIGPNKAGPQPTPAEAALMAGEEFLQLIQSGMPMACFWPLHWEAGDPSRAVLSSKRRYAPNTVFGMFEKFASARGAMQLRNEASGAAAPRMSSLAVRRADGTLDVFLINKHLADAGVQVSIDVGVAGTRAGGLSATAVGFDASDTAAGPLAVHPLPTHVTGGRVTLTLPRYSFAKVTVR